MASKVYSELLGCSDLSCAERPAIAGGDVREAVAVDACLILRLVSLLGKTGEHIA